MSEQVAQSEEVPWNFQRGEASVSPAVMNWRLDAMHEKIDRLTVPVKEATAAAMEGLRAAMTNLSERGPDPDVNANDEDMRMLIKAFVDLSRQKGPSYNNGGDDSGDLRKWIAGLGLVLAGAFIIGAWTLSTQVATLTAKVDAIADHQRAADERISRIEQNERRP